MDTFTRSDSDRTTRSLPACPACTSPSVTTTARHPNADTYWRCERCGEIWNVGRRADARAGTRSWR